MSRIFGFLAALVFGVAAVGAQQAPDRSHPPQLGPAPALQLPQIQKRQLANGLPVWLVELHEVPVAQVNLVVFAGSANEPAMSNAVDRNAIFIHSFEHIDGRDERF